MADGENVYIVNPSTGKRGYVPKSELESWAKAGYQPETAEATENARLEAEYGDSPGQAFLEGAASGITFGASDLALRALDEEGARERAERNPWAHGAGTLGGAVLTGGMGAGGALTRAGEAAEGLVTAGKAATMGTKLLGAGTRGAVEGLGYGAGAGVSEVALSEDPITWEGAVATIGSDALGGAVLGGGIGVGGKLLAEGAQYARNAANQKLELLAKGEQSVDRGAFPEMANLDAKATAKEIGLEDEAIKARKAEAIKQNFAETEAEMDSIKAQKTEQAKQLYREAEDFEKWAAQGENFVPTSNAKIRKNFSKGTRKLMGGLDDEADFVQKLGKGAFQKGLQEEETALNRVVREAQALDRNAEQQAFLDGLPRRGSLPKAETELPFHQQVLNAAKRVPESERFGQQAYISDVWLEMPGTMSLDEFKTALGKEAAEGRVGLARGDMPSVMDAERLAASEVGAKAGDGLSAQHFVQIDEAAGQVPMAYLSADQAAAYSRWLGKPLKEAKSLAVPEPQLLAFREAVEAGDVLSPSLQRVETAERVLEANRALQARFKELQAEPVTQKLRDLKTQLEQIKADTAPTPRKQALQAHMADLQSKDLGHGIAQGVGGLLGGKIGMATMGPYGAVAGAFIGRDAGIRFYDRFVRKIVSGNANRGKVISASIAKAFATGAEKVAKAAPKATRAIPAIQYATREHVDSVLGPDNTKPSKDERVTEFRQRAREINALTERSPEGFKVRMQALQMLHDKMAMAWQIAPGVANGIEKTQAAKLQFLASKLPRNPAPPHLQLGPDTWEPNEAQIAAFFRVMQAAEHPEVVPQHLAEGTATPDEVEALKTIYPAHYEDIRKQVFDHAADLKETLPYAQRLSLSILLDVDVDPALTREALTVYQMPPPPPEQQKPPAQNKPLPVGMIEPTRAQRYSSK